MMTLGELGEKIKIYTHYHVREDNISLYGFTSNEELKMFELLLQVSGIGAKTAITMLSNITPSQFALAVISNDIKELVKNTRNRYKISTKNDIRIKKIS